jgi:hypothetical protein
VRSRCDRRPSHYTERPDWYRFAHALVEHTLYDRLSPTRRAHAHNAIADALETLPSDDPGERTAELAYHWACAQPSVHAKAVHYARLAGDLALEQLAPDDAIRWYSQALELLGRDETTDSTRCDLLLGLGTAQRQAGSPNFRRTLLDAANFAQRLGDTDRVVQAALTNTRSFAASIGRLDAERVDVLRAAVQAIGTSSRENRARLLAQWAIESIWTPDYDTDALIAEALELTEGTDDFEARGRALLALYINYMPQNLNLRQARLRECLDVAKRVDPSLRGPMYHGVIHMAMQAGNHVEARAFLDDYERVYSMLSDPTQRWVSAWFRASFALLEGDAASAEKHAENALQIAMENGEPDGMIGYGSQIIEIRILQGREAEIVDLIAQVARDNPGLPVARTGLAYLLAATDRTDEARAVLDDISSDLAFLPVGSAGTTALAFLARAAAITNHAESTRAVVQTAGWIHGPMGLERVQ